MDWSPDSIDLIFPDIGNTLNPLEAPMPDALRPVRIIQHQVAAVHGLTVGHLVGKTRLQRVCRAREEAIMRAIAETGLSMAEIAGAFNRDRSSVWYIRQKNREQVTEKAQMGHWTPTQDALLIKYRDEGLGARAIAAKIQGKSRNAVIGRMTRKKITPASAMEKAAADERARIRAAEAQAIADELAEQIERERIALELKRRKADTNLCEHHDCTNTAQRGQRHGLCAGHATKRYLDETARMG